MATFNEPNDTLLESTETGINGIGTAFFNGSIGDNPNILPGLDVDIFELQLNAGELLKVDIDAEVLGSEDLDSYLRLFDASGTEVAFNDDADGLDSLLTFLAPTTGTYYVGFSDLSNNDYDPTLEGSDSEADTGDYTITFDVSAFNAGPEPNDTLTEAIQTGINGIGTATFDGFLGDNPNIAPGLDIDLYQVQINAGEQLTVDIDAEVIGSDDLDSYLRLFDASGTEVAFNDDDGDTSDSLLNFVVTTPGTYYVGVSDLGNDEYNPTLEGSGSEDDTGFIPLPSMLLRLTDQNPMTPSPQQLKQASMASAASLKVERSAITPTLHQV
ncbi:PPC domain-containing protein [Coleofasciculus sp. F4-SAH-05]|uniref:PPC domain-containing protein n=1 Tax=Coleofasciculus sp. F4-SAH-05 TaxID=3069525 RepID=UPI0032F63951